MNPRSVFPPETIAQFCRKWNIVEFSLFGSVLRDDFHQDSDLDVLVGFAADAQHTLFDLVRMQEELRGIVGREVDLVEKTAIERSRNYLRRQAILGTAEVVYEA